MRNERTEGAPIVWRIIFIMAILVTITFALYPNFRLSTFFYGIKIHDAVVHMAAFAVITIVAAGAWQLKMSFIIQLVLFALALELAQTAVPGRVVNLVDAAANLGGIVMGLFVVVASMHLRRSLLRWT